MMDAARAERGIEDWCDASSFSTQIHTTHTRVSLTQDSFLFRLPTTLPVRPMRPVSFPTPTPCPPACVAPPKRITAKKTKDGSFGVTTAVTLEIVKVAARPPLPCPSPPPLLLSPPQPPARTRTARDTRNTQRPHRVHRTHRKPRSVVSASSLKEWKVSSTAEPRQEIVKKDSRPFTQLLGDMDAAVSRVVHPSFQSRVRQQFLELTASIPTIRCRGSKRALYALFFYMYKAHQMEDLPVDPIILGEKMGIPRSKLRKAFQWFMPRLDTTNETERRLLRLSYFPDPTFLVCAHLLELGFSTDAVCTQETRHRLKLLLDTIPTSIQEQVNGHSISGSLCMIAFGIPPERVHTTLHISRRTIAHARPILEPALTQPNFLDFVRPLLSEKKSSPS